MALPIRLGVLRALVKEISVSGASAKPLVVGGARELAGGAAARARPRREAGRGARRRRAEGRRRLRLRARPRPDARPTKPRSSAPAARACRSSPSPPGRSPTTSRSRTCSRPTSSGSAPGEGFPVEAIARVIAARLGEEGAPLAARVPVLRRAVCERLVAAFAQEERRSSAPRCSSPASTCPCSR